MQALLAKVLGFPADSIRVLRDDSNSNSSSSSSDGVPSREAILQELEWLVCDAADVSQRCCKASHVALLFSVTAIWQLMSYVCSLICLCNPRQLQVSL
jgi:hypothetical protein